MTTTSAIQPRSIDRTVRTSQLTLKCLFGLVPIAAGADKFTNLLTNWEQYLNPMLLRIVPVTATTFMHIVGVIEIIAGLLVFIKPRVGGTIVMLWLLGIVLQLVLMGRYFDIAVRDVGLAIGALTLVRLTPFAEAAPARS